MRTLALALLLAVAPQDAPPRVLPEGKIPADLRLGPPKDLDGSFPFEVPATREAWARRADELRRRVAVALGLWPLPERTPLQAKIWGRAEREDFTAEKVAFESVPGHFVTGLLFRPRGKKGPFPAVLSPHGHEGRLWDYGANVRRMITEGQERFERSGRMPQLARCATLARLGCVVFIHDMLGYADSVQIPTAVAHRFSKQRPGFDTHERWGFFSAPAELRLQSILGVQAWNCVRALDFLAGLPDVDPARIGVTGSSGGGTQTILTCAIDPRPVVAFPQGMVSISMQGGCTCENACYLRIGTGNVELAALFAPKPQGMTAANDWTKEMMTKGFPELEKLYALLGAKGSVLCKNHVHFPHNYNYVARAAMYALFNRHLKLGHPEPIVEEDFEPLTPAEYRVWDAEHPAPASGEAVEAALLKGLAEASDRQIAALGPAERRKVLEGALDVMIGRRVPPAGAVTREKVDKLDRGDFWQFKDILRVPAYGEELPAISFFPKRREWNGKVVIWADGEGKAGLFGAAGAPRVEVKKLLEAGFSVLGADLLHQGDFLADGKPLREQPKVKNTREYAGFTYGYNPPLFARRVHDLLTLVSFVAADEHAPREVILVGAGGAGPWAAAARAQAGGAVARALIDTRGFRFAGLPSYRDPDFLPGALKYGDLPGMLSLSAPHALWVAGEGGRLPEAVSAAYAAAGRADAARATESLAAAVEALAGP
jgi:dienelactone hydrolase